MATGISNQGTDAEQLFFALVTSSRKAPKASAGDAVVNVDGIDVTVEVKKCDAPNGSGTINQVRAIKFIPMVVHNPSRNEWFVVPAAELVRAAASKSRGQHTEIPFESMNMSLSQVTRWKCSSAELDAALRAAVRFDRNHKVLGIAMVALLASIKSFGDHQKAEIARLLTSVPTWVP